MARVGDKISLEDRFRLNYKLPDKRVLVYKETKKKLWFKYKGEKYWVYKEPTGDPDRPVYRDFKDA